MTRFMIDVDAAIDLIEEAFKFSGYNVIPKLKSFSIKDLFELYAENFDLKYNIGAPRISEKIHEIMVSPEEMPRVKDIGDYYLMHYKDIFTKNSFEYSSKDVVVSKEELNTILKVYNYFKS